MFDAARDKLWHGYKQSAQQKTLQAFRPELSHKSIVVVLFQIVTIDIIYINVSRFFFVSLLCDQTLETRRIIYVVGSQIRQTHN